MFSREERGVMKLLVALQNYHCRRRRCSMTVTPESTMAVAEILRRLFHGGGWKAWRSYVEVLWLVWWQHERWKHGDHVKWNDALGYQLLLFL